MIFIPKGSNFQFLSRSLRHFRFTKDMAASSPPNSESSLHSNIVTTEKPETEECATLSSEDAFTKREPVINLLSPVSGLQPLVWSEDHRLAACTSGSLSVMELVCDINSNKQELTLHRTSIAVPTEAHRFQVYLQVYLVG